jgi:hypothetical protein
MKKFFSGLIVGLLVSVSLTAFAVQLKVVPNPFPVFINGDKAQVDAYNINGSTYLKLADLKTAGLDVKFADSKINVTSAYTEAEPTEPSFPDYTIPEIDNTNNPNNVTRLEDGDSFDKITYNKYSAIKYDNNVYVSMWDLAVKYKMKSKLSGQSNSFNLFDKDGNLILKTADANKVNFIYYNGTAYLNINLILKYLEN